MVTSQPPEQARVIEQDGLVDALVQAAFVTMAVLNKVGADNDLSLTQAAGARDPAGPTAQDDLAR